ncbi:hypothetical protein FA95DRAFT_637606 [Auriscalpium vulgare]|uniref:Uncharacterized protein n=1 Tax=Auriscalpium vulgare TaxID=40419 RepID=A0ACB8RCQ9_9AGAM|nr:hypothetical protein FA95DRAFT_637606 [Auriscalpium vulgare]
MSACDESTRAPDPTFMMALTALVMGALGFFASIVAVVLPFLVPGLRNMDAVSHTARHGRPQHLLTPASPVARPMPASPLASSDSLDVADTDVPPAHVDDALHVSFNGPGPSHAHVPIPIVVPPPLSDTSGASPLSSAETLADASAPSLSPKPSLKTTLSVRLAHAIRRRGSAAAAAPAPTLAATPASPYSASSRRPLFGRRATTLSASDVNEPSGLEQTASEFGEISAGASSGAESGRERGRFGFRALKRTRTVGGGQARLARARRLGATPAQTLRAQRHRRVPLASFGSEPHGRVTPAHITLADALGSGRAATCRPRVRPRRVPWAPVPPPGIVHRVVAIADEPRSPPAYAASLHVAAYAVASGPRCHTATRVPRSARDAGLGEEQVRQVEGARAPTRQTQGACAPRAHAAVRPAVQRAPTGCGALGRAGRRRG